MERGEGGLFMSRTERDIWGEMVLSKSSCTVVLGTLPQTQMCISNDVVHQRCKQQGRFTAEVSLRFIFWTIE